MEIRGVDITDTSKPTREILASLKEKGVTMSRSILHRLRDGETSGNRIRYRIRCEDLPSADDSSLKNRFYLEILSEALRLRDSREPDFRYDPAGFTENVASNLSFEDSQQVRRALRAMRADLVYRELENPKALLNQTFKQAAGDFLIIIPKHLMESLTNLYNYVQNGILK